MAINKIGDKYRKYNVLRTSIENGVLTHVFSIAGYEFGVSDYSISQAIKNGKAVIVDGIVEYIKAVDFARDRHNVGKLSIPFDKDESDANAVPANVEVKKRPRTITNIKSFKFIEDGMTIKYEDNHIQKINKAESINIQLVIDALRNKISHPCGLSGIEFDENDHVVKVRFSHYLDDDSYIELPIDIRELPKNDDINDYLQELGNRWAAEIICDDRISEIIDRFHMDYDYQPSKLIFSYKTNDTYRSITIPFKLTNIDRARDQVFACLSVYLYPEVDSDLMNCLYGLFEKHSLKANLVSVTPDKEILLAINGIQVHVPISDAMELLSKDEVTAQFILGRYISQYLELVLEQAMAISSDTYTGDYKLIGGVSPEQDDILDVKLMIDFDVAEQFKININNVVSASFTVKGFLDLHKEHQVDQSCVSTSVPDIESLWDNGNGGNNWGCHEFSNAPAVNNDKSVYDMIAEFEAKLGNSSAIKNIEFLVPDKSIIKICIRDSTNEKSFIIHNGVVYKQI